MTTTDDKIAARCPACGGHSLFIGAGGHITCGRLDCPRPTAADELLNDLGPEHIVHLTETEFAVEHPLVERLEHRILACTLHAWLKAQADAPHPPGWYKVAWSEPGDGVWEPILDPTNGAKP